ncbi:MAG: PhzF family phenazine biosynthesis protein [Pseudomonadota bacterium]
MHPYHIFDVFTDRPLSGNPLAILPDAKGLSDAQMQAIAAEFNLSETVFILPPKDPVHTARLRIFAPRMELPFAGHPLIGTAIHLAMEGELFNRPVGDQFTLETGIGPLPFDIDRTKETPVARLTNTVGLKHHHDVPIELAAACLSLPASAIETTAHSPQILSKGLPYLLVELADRQALSESRPDIPAFSKAEATYPTGEGPISIYPYWQQDLRRVHARMFDPLAGIFEDPATGSAAAALGALLCQLRKTDVQIDIKQGYDMGRPSRIGIFAQSDAPSGSSVQLSGGAVKVMQGTLSL